jgi:hypothetical protein
VIGIIILVLIAILAALAVVAIRHGYDDIEKNRP